MIQKEFIQTLRDRGTLRMLLTMPLIQLFLFGYAIDMNVDHIPTLVADQSLDSASLAYVDALVNSGYFDVVRYATDQADVIRAIDAGEVQAGIVIPPDFAAHVERGDAQVLVLVDGSDLFTTQSAYNMATAVAQSHAADVMLQRLERAGLPISGALPLDTRTRILYNPDMEQLRFVVPNIVAMLMQTQTIAMTAAAVVREREAGTIEQLLVTPIRSGELMIGKIVPNIAIALFNVLSVISLGTLIFGVPFRGNFWLFMGLSMLYVFSGLGLGLLISTVANNLRQSQQIVMMMLLLGVVLGGYLFPRSTMPTALQLVGFIFPLTYFIPISRGIISKGVGFDALWLQVAGLALYSAAIMTVATRAFRQGLD